jgi:hypothetical protein
MTQTSGLFPQLSSGEKLAIKRQLMPTPKAARVRSPRRRRPAVVPPQIVVEPLDARQAVKARFGTPAKVEGGIHERRAAARGKAGR